MASISELTSEEKLRHIINSAFKSLVGQLIVDKNGIVLFYSDEHEKYIGIKKEDAIGKHVTEVVPNTRMHIIAKTGEPECGMIYYYENIHTGEMTPAICNRIPIKENGEVIGVMSETIFTKGFNDVKVLSEGLKELQFNPSRYFDVVGVKQGIIERVCGNSPSMSELKRALPKFADFSLPILIIGETGTGKEVFADTIHNLSYRRNRPFVKINCAAIPAPLLESELFGYEPGAFSGAVKEGKIGKFQYADEGTILLDEIGEMPMELQSKLLRVLQEREFERVGGLKSIPMKARVICTTNRDIKELIAKGKFREDLYYRINVLELKIPPLRERKEDIKILINFFIKEMNFEEGTSIDGITDHALAALESYSWPGNVRELRHVIQRACALTGAGMLKIEDFTFFFREIESPESDLSIDSETNCSLSKIKTDAEIKAIKRAMELCNYNKSQAAKMLGIDRSILYTKLSKYKII